MIQYIKASYRKIRLVYRLERMMIEAMVNGKWSLAANLHKRLNRVESI